MFKRSFRLYFFIRQMILFVLSNTLTLFLLFFISPVHAQWSNEIELEYRYFFNDPQFSEQEQHAPSIVYKPVWSHVSESGNSVFDFRGYARYDDSDDERTHVDINELTWLYLNNDWEFKVGIGKVYWGVAESQHLVDIVNQTDLIDAIDGETKLGQPMLGLSKVTDVGVFDAFVLPYFRERTFAGSEGRLRTQPFVKADAAVYESSDEQSHVDYALRWSHSFGIFDFGLSYFDGTGRDPVLSSSEDNTFLIPTYVQIQQLGIDVQATLDAWLWKLEAIDRSASDQYENQNFQSVVAGFEYTFFDVATSGIDVGLVAEYSYDKRGEQATPFDDYALVAVRLAFNDEQSTDLLLGCSVNGDLCAIEGSRRLGENYKLSLQGNLFSGIEDDSAFASQRQDDYLQIGLSYFF